MRLVELHVKGFGRLADVDVLFGRGLTVIAGPNESGKTTLVECIVRLLFGYPSARYNEDRKRFAPWSGGRYEASIVYALDEGPTLETWRDFAKSEVPTKTVDFSTKREAREYSGTRETSPGSMHLKLSLAAFEAAAVIRAAEFAQATDDDARKAHKLLAERIAALVGAAGDASAAAAIERLKQFISNIGGAPNATRSLLTGARARLQTASGTLDEYTAAFEAARANIERRAQLRQELSDQDKRREELVCATNLAELMSVRAQLRDAGVAQSDLSRARSEHPSGDGPSPELLAHAHEIEDAIARWHSAQTDAARAESSAHEKETERDQARQALDTCEERIRDADGRVAQWTAALARLAPRAGSAQIDEDTLGRLEQLHDDADLRESLARKRETEFAIARQRPNQGPIAALLVGGIAVAALIVGFLAHLPVVEYGAGLAFVAGVVLFGVWTASTRRAADGMQTLDRGAEDSRAAAEQAAKQLLAECRALGCDDIHGARAARMAQFERERIGDKLVAANKEAAQAREHQDVLQRRMADLARLDQDVIAMRNECTERERALTALLDAGAVRGDGIETRVENFRAVHGSIASFVQVTENLSGAQVKLATALAGSTIEALRTREAELVAATNGQPGIMPSSDPELDSASLTSRLRTAEERMHQAEKALEGVAGELRDFEKRYPDGGAALEEHVAEWQVRAASLESSRAAAVLARDAIEAAKVTVHSDFAPVLGAAVGSAAAAITSGRYAEAGVDPDDFSVRVRSPEGQAWVEASDLSSGTREQLYLSLRAALVQELGSGEQVPLLLDDALAHADETRQRNAVRHLAELGARGQQIIVLTQRDGLVEAARAIPGVEVVTLDGP